MPAIYNVCLQKQIRDNLEARQREQQEWDKEYNQQGFTEVQNKGETNCPFQPIFEAFELQKPDQGSPGGRSAGRASRDRDSKTRERFVQSTASFLVVWH